MTVTLPPTVPLTATPSFTETPIFTLIPTLPQTLLDMGLSTAELSHYTVDTRGNVIDDRFPPGSESEYAKVYTNTAEGLQHGHIFTGNDLALAGHLKTMTRLAITTEG